MKKDLFLNLFNVVAPLIRHKNPLGLKQASRKIGDNTIFVEIYFNQNAYAEGGDPFFY